jgi:hypothetical protein
MKRNIGGIVQLRDKMKKLILIVIIGSLVGSVVFFSGCIEASYTMNGKITSLTRYVDDKERDLIKIGFANRSAEIVYYDSVKQYHLSVGDDVIITFKIVGSFLDPMEVKNVWKHTVEG